eukprot:5472016-Prymnesium_polylepis.1
MPPSASTRPRSSPRTTSSSMSTARARTRISRSSANGCRACWASLTMHIFASQELDFRWLWPVPRVIVSEERRFRVVGGVLLSVLGVRGVLHVAYPPGLFLISRQYTVGVPSSDVVVRRSIMSI